MSRADRLLFGVLVIAALVVGTNVVVGAAGWGRSWHAYEEFVLELTTVEVQPDLDGVAVGIRVGNRSNVPMQVIRITTAVQANGHSVAAGRLTSGDVSLVGGSQQELVIPNDVLLPNRPAFEEQLAAGPIRWTVSGQVELHVDGLAKSTLIPYRGFIDEQ